MKVAFKSSSFKNSSYHIPRASDIQAMGLRKDLEKKTLKDWGYSPRKEKWIANLALTHWSQRDPHVPPDSSPPLIPFLQHGAESYLEGILLGKVQNHVPPLPSGIGGIKHLGREITK